MPLYHDGLLLDHGTPDGLALTAVLLHAFWVPNLGDWAQRSWNGPSWSISIELMFYVLAGFGWKFAGRWTWVIAPLLSLFVLFALRPQLYPSWEFPGYLPLRGIAGFGFGMAAWQIWCRVLSLRNGLSVAAATALEFVVAAAAVTIVCAGEMRDGLFFLDVCFGLLILVFVGDRGLLSALLRTPAFV